MWSERLLRYERLTWPEVRLVVVVQPQRGAGRRHHGRRRQGPGAVLAAAVAECVAYVDELLATPLPRRRPPVTGS